MQTVSLTLFRYARPAARLWAFAAMGLGPGALSRTPGLSFCKQLGSGTGEGFTPRPNWGVYGVLAAWESREAAEAGVRDGAPFRRRRGRAAESWTVYLRPISARGRWSGRAPFDAPERAAEAPTGPIAALTRASIRPSRMARFWRHEPAISARIGADAAVLFKIGLGEAPLLRQATFSIWPDLDSMAAFARAGGPHAEAARAVRAEGVFSEELYARFEILGDEGLWGGVRPLEAAARAQAAQAEPGASESKTRVTA